MDKREVMKAVSRVAEWAVYEGADCDGLVPVDMPNSLRGLDPIQALRMLLDGRLPPDAVPRTGDPGTADAVECDCCKTSVWKYRAVTCVDCGKFTCPDCLRGYSCEVCDGAHASRKNATKGPLYWIVNTNELTYVPVHDPNFEGDWKHQYPHVCDEKYVDILQPRLVEHDKTPAGIYFTYDLCWDGGLFRLWTDLELHDKQMLKEAEAWLRGQRDVVSLTVFRLRNVAD